MDRRRYSWAIGGAVEVDRHAARKDMQKVFDAKVMLKLWVKVKSGWSVTSGP